METCPICTHAAIDTADERAANACQACQAKLGLIPMPAAKRRGPCRACGGTRFLRAIPREHSMRTNDVQVCAPMFVTHAPCGYHGSMVRSAKPLEVSHGLGRLEVYVCFGCEAVQWYCAEVYAIPVHPHLMTQIVDETDEPAG